MSRLARLGFAVELAREGDERDEALARVRKEADRITTLVGELLQFTRIEGDPAAGKWGNVALHHLLDDIVNDCDLEAEARGCRLVLRSVQPAVISGERELLHRAVENIVRNAIRHAPEGTTVELALVLRGDMAIASVRDHGPGVPEALPMNSPAWCVVWGDCAGAVSGSSVGRRRTISPDPKYREPMPEDLVSQRCAWPQACCAMATASIDSPTAWAAD